MTSPVPNQWLIEGADEIIVAVISQSYWLSKLTDRVNWLYGLIDPSTYMNHRPLVCIIDDSADYRLLLQHVFHRYLPIYSVQLFAGGESLLDELPRMSQKPNVVLLDRHMPDLDGHQTLVRLKQNVDYKSIPVVMMSAMASELEIGGCYEACANSFLIKPVGLDSIKETMVTICRYWLALNQVPTER